MQRELHRRIQRHLPGAEPQNRGTKLSICRVGSGVGQRGEPLSVQAAQVLLSGGMVTQGFFGKPTEWDCGLSGTAGSGTQLHQPAVRSREFSSDALT